jgi:endonuclease G
VGSERAWAGTGNLIAPDVVITSGHMHDFAAQVFFGHDITQPGKIALVKKRIRHPRYSNGLSNDLMVLLLAHSVESVPPRRIATQHVVDAATEGRIVGFGSSDPYSLDFGVKRFVDVLVISPACQGTVAGRPDCEVYGCVTGLELVAGDSSRQRDSGRGDGGGPFYVLDATDQWVLGGVTSRAINSSRTASGDGGIYVRVDRYLPWIETIKGVALP